jgi:hypothetical protein
MLSPAIPSGRQQKRPDARNMREFYVRNANNDPVPLDAIATMARTSQVRNSPSATTDTAPPN